MVEAADREWWKDRATPATRKPLDVLREHSSVDQRETAGHEAPVYEEVLLTLMHRSHNDPALRKAAIQFLVGLENRVARGNPDEFFTDGERQRLTEFLEDSARRLRAEGPIELNQQ